MHARPLIALAVCTFLGSDAVCAAGVDTRAVYFDGGQYTAELEQHAQRWRVSPVQGYDVDVVGHASACVNRVHVPHGVWVVTSDAAGRPQLLAPSATLLPVGFPQQLRLRACNDNSDGIDADGAKVLLVPDVVLDWIKTNVGSVMIND